MHVHVCMCACMHVCRQTSMGLKIEHTKVVDSFFKLAWLSTVVWMWKVPQSTCVKILVFSSTLLSGDGSLKKWV